MSESIGDNGLSCTCPPGTSGSHCEYGGLTIDGGQGGGKATAIVLPIVVALLVLLTGAAAWFVIRKRPL